MNRPKLSQPEKLSISLERQLTKLFALATVLVVLVVVIGIYIANMQLRDSASNFISSHVTSLVESGVSTQNVSEIDREVRRLYNAWSQAQKTDIRISVLIDGVLVGKAGPLPPFGWMSSREMLETGRPLAKLENKSLLAIVESAVRQRNEISGLLGETPRLELSVESSQPPLSIHSSFTTGLEDSIIAIIDNALEASEGTRSIVHVACGFEADVARIRVTDSGCGIAPDILPRLMQERATFGKSDGNGLGLFHASELMKRMGGQVEIESALGRGTTVTLVIKNSFEYEAAN